MTINDYYDRKIDAVNEPSRPIPSGLVGVKEALVFVGVLTVAGLVLAYFSSVLCLLVAAASMGNNQSVTLQSANAVAYQETL